MRTKPLGQVPVGTTVEVQATITAVNVLTGVATMSIVQPDTGVQVGSLTLNMGTGVITGSLDNALTTNVRVVRGDFAIGDVVEWQDGSWLVVQWISDDGTLFSTRTDGGGSQYGTADVTKIGTVAEVP